MSEKKENYRCFCSSVAWTYVSCMCLQRESKRKIKTTSLRLCEMKNFIYFVSLRAPSFTYMVRESGLSSHTRRTFGRNMGYFSHCMQNSADHRCHYNVTHSTSPWKTKPKIMFNIRWNEKAFSPHAPKNEKVIFTFRAAWTAECMLHTFERIKSRIKFNIFKTPPTEKNVLHEKRNFFAPNVKN